MIMKFKTFALIIALSAFSASLFAQPVTYSFSGFGGGLPASAKKVGVTKTSDTMTSQQIIIEDDDVDESTDEEYTYDYSDEPKVNKNKNAALIATYIVVGAVVVAGIVFGAVYLSGESAACCESGTDSFIQGCGEGCAESCGQGLGDACAASMEGACSGATEQACSSSSSSTECSSTSGLFSGNGLALIPIYVP